MSRYYQSPEDLRFNWAEIQASEAAYPKRKITFKLPFERRTRRTRITMECGHNRLETCPVPRLGARVGCGECYGEAMEKAQQMIEASEAQKQ